MVVFLACIAILMSIDVILLSFNIIRSATNIHVLACENDLIVSSPAASAQQQLVSTVYLASNYSYTLRVVDGILQITFDLLLGI